MTKPALLVVDTIGPWCACAVSTGDGVFERAENIGRGHAERLAPMAAELLEDAGISPPSLDRVGVNIGPGGFAGTRVGVAFVRGLALSTGAKALGVSNLDALALRADAEGDRTVMAIHDARRGDLVWRIFTHGRPVTEVSYGDARDAADEFEAFGDVILTGSGAVHLGADPSHFDPAPPLHELLALTERAAADAPSPSPLYARPPDAKLPGGKTPA
ncbi:tRNA (adenosine(37)-N6)-threonylcarbamoyltransferase complex dimerization subunit type 1 TsaB [Oceanicaulis sp. LC35]|uniref:tRNA (adenosine(37)-N6)-threonylcarbamoyltransferase complex dimerization subunit type 1 TsaB n=1 Tax=Oceanicaulis sp. LC35 TaxID=3349635 RepID=UPI003F83F2B4